MEIKYNVGRSVVALLVLVMVFTGAVDIAELLGGWMGIGDRGKFSVAALLFIVGLAHMANLHQDVWKASQKSSW